ncbi:hypothetical protein HII31_09457 [Pseudocercospora fuligena]|uniref:Uncharacterized protein n=1 Tax=Pseudocercospora fuligena TaxID=685502 RepID=A0A8H6RE73_9PEZI|nr:hypothetical protein HII31_09457 [Pseudocercospora fuligena]
MDICSSREVAEQLNNLSIFIREGFCKGMVMTALPCYKHMNHLSKRLHDYAYSIAMTASPRFIPLPDQNTTLDFSTAIKTMEKLVAFFQQTIQRLEQSDLAAAAELAMVKDLEIAIQRSKILLRLSPNSLENIDQPPRIFTKQADTGMWTETNGGLRTVLPVASPDGKLNKKKDRDGDVSPLILGSPVLQSDRRVQFARRSSSAPIPGSSTRPQASSDAQSGSNYLQVPPVSIHTPNSSGAATPAGFHTPTELRPHPHVLQHAPHVLQRLRLESQCGLLDSDAFSQKYDKLIGRNLDSPPDIHRTVQLGHEAQDPPDVGVYVNAMPLELPGIDTIHLILPLCAREVRSIDYDVLRYIHLALCQSPSIASSVGGPGNAKTARKASRALHRSRAIVQREVASRAFEIEHAKLHDDKQSPPFSEHVQRGIESAMIESALSSHEPATAGPKSVEADHNPRGEADHHPSPPLQVFMASIETSIGPRKLLHRRRASDTSSEIVAPGPAVPPSSHASSEIGIGGIGTPEKSNESPISERHHSIRARPHLGVQRGSSTGRITPVKDAVSHQASDTSQSARKRRAEAKNLDRERAWSVDSPPTSACGRGDWTTRNLSVKTESSFKHDDWIEKALTPNSIHQPEAISKIQHLKDQISVLQDQVARLTAKSARLDKPSTSGRREVINGVEWIEQPDPFQGRSSPPYVAHMNTKDGKLYVLDTADGVPEPLNKSETPLRSSRRRRKIGQTDKIGMTGG